MKEFIDELDIKILNILLKDAKKPYAEIGKQLFVSPGTVHVRVKKMADQGIITGSQITVDHTRLGYDVTAYLGIYLAKSNMYEEVKKALKQIPEIITADYTTGVYSIFAKVRCKDTNHLKEIISEGIQNIEGIQRTETFISLESSIDRPMLLPEKN